MKKLSDLFDVRYGNGLALAGLMRVKPQDGIAFVSRKARDNGIAAYVAEIPGEPINPAGDLTCALNGQGGVLATFVQERPFYTAFHVACLRAKSPLTSPQKLYYCTCIWANHYRYSWGRQANRTLRDILLPDVSEIPEWVEGAGADIAPGADSPAEHGEIPELSSATWKLFRLSSLFDIKKGSRLTKANMRLGSTPFIGAVEVDNGWTNMVSQPPEHPGNTITVPYNGNGVADAFYQPVPYRCSDDVNVLYPKFAMTPAIAMFIAAIIRREKYRFSYGRKWHLERMLHSEIWLPSSPHDDTPDWEFMERLIRRLPYSSRI